MKTLTTAEYYETLAAGERPVFDQSASGFVIHSQRDLGTFAHSYEHCVHALARSRGIALADDEHVLPSEREMETHHVQVNGISLCRAASAAYITALGGPHESIVCHCRHRDATSAINEAKALAAKLDPESFTVSVSIGACAEPGATCFRISAPGTH